MTTVVCVAVKDIATSYKYEYSSSVMGEAAYHGLVCAVYSVRVSMCREVRGLPAQGNTH